MRPSVCVSTALAVLLSLAFYLPARAQSDDRQVLEAGPEDGILCCFGSPFLFNGDGVLMATGRAGFFRSERRGERWQRSMQGFVAPNGVSPFVGFPCQAPSEPRIVYALAGLGSNVTPFNGLFSSADFGGTWTRRAAVDFAFGVAFCEGDADDPLTVYVSGFDANFVNHTWRSTDGGQTVQIFDASLPACAVGGGVRSLRGTLYVYGVFTPQCAFASTDRGLSFHPLSVPPGFIAAFEVSPNGSTILIDTGDENFQVTGTFRSTDGGASFVAVSGLPNGGVGGAAFDPTDPSRIYASDGLLHVSTDGGLSFTSLPASNDPRFLGLIPVIGIDSRGSVYIGTRGGPFRTDDRGQTFRSLLNGFRASSVTDLAFDADGHLLVAVQHTQVVYRQTRGRSFRAIGTPLNDPTSFLSTDAASVAGSPTDANVALVATGSGHGLFRTDNGGQSWSSAAVAGNPTLFNDSRMVFVTGSRVYLVAPSRTGARGLYRSDDAGQSFARLSPLPFGAIAVDPIDPDVLYVGTYGSPDGLFKSTDGGHNLLPLDPKGGFSALAVDRRNRKVVYAGQQFGQVLRSIDGGQSFAPASSGLAGLGVHGLAQDSHGTLFVWLRGGGLFSSNDGAASWQPVDIKEAVRRSGVEAGRGALATDPHRPGRVYLGNAAVIRVDTGDQAD
jgi:photosystem II stability/assembly factor-like uncharacterized protein